MCSPITQSAQRQSGAAYALSGGPSIFFDAVLVAHRPTGGNAREGSGRDRLDCDAFGHLEVIGVVDAATPLLDRAGIEADAGVVAYAGKGVNGFIHCREERSDLGSGAEPAKSKIDPHRWKPDGCVAAPLPSLEQASRHRIRVPPNTSTDLEQNSPADEPLKDTLRCSDWDAERLRKAVRGDFDR